MSEISQELVERMVVLVRDLAEASSNINYWRLRGASIVAELPAPVDPDLLEAREIVAVAIEDLEETSRGWERPKMIRQGAFDLTNAVQLALSTIKREGK